MALQNSGAVSSLAEHQCSPPTLGVTFDLGHELVLAWEEPREQADYLGGFAWSYGEAKGQAAGKQKVGDCVEVVWV